MSFFAATTTTNIAAKPHIRQEGFVPDDLFSNNIHAKYPASPLNLPSMDFGDELAGLMADGNRSPNGYHQQHQQQQQSVHDHYRHNIFDTSSVSSTASVYPAFNGSQPSSLHSDFASFHSPLPAVNSSMRYDPPQQHPQQQQQQQQQHDSSNPPPSSFHSHSHLTSNSNRHSPSPVGSGSLHSPVMGSSTSAGRGVGSRSRSGSDSRPPVVASSSSSSSSNTNSANGGTTGSIGPARTSRTRRNGSISGTSPPPPGHGHGRPHAIVIPGSGRGGAATGSGSWFVNGGQSSPHPTNQHRPLSLHQQQQQHHGHHGHTASLSHSLSHSGALNGMMGGFGMGMNSLDGSMGMMGGIGMANGGLSLGSLNPLQSPSLQTSNNNNSTLSTSPSSQPLLTSSSTGSSSPHSATTIITNHQDKQSILANEKRRRRRESHNAVERRRRDNINEKISELATLIPECMLDGGGSGPANGGSSPPHLTPTSPGAGGMGFLDSSDPLLPTSYGLANAHGNGSSSPIGIKEECGGAGVEEGGGVVKANKGMILRKSVDYIRYLQQLVTAQGARNRELEQELEAYRRSSGGSGGGDSINSDSPDHGYQLGESLKEEIGDDDDVLGVVGGFGMGIGRTTPGL